MFYFNASHGNPMKIWMPDVLFGDVVPIIVKIIFFFIELKSHSIKLTILKHSTH